MNRIAIEQALEIADNVLATDNAIDMYSQLQAIQGLLYFELAADDIRIDKLVQPVQPAIDIHSCSHNCIRPKCVQARVMRK